MYAARGYVVLMPNPRGSTGYGQKFVEDISGDWGGKAYMDIMNGVDQLAAMPFVDGADRKSTRLNSSHSQISYAVFCLKKKKHQQRAILYNNDYGLEHDSQQRLH